ncbi:RsiV family protein [Rodentibacter myodis]|uniref:DUF3298 domain-containing protein n=1 Tax=Rodentibacter myodis TaxID=1907939 RepID=A0A1V3JGM8_9PAST|nr:RsiV family protein [Rodentibacter myodis]OOF55784.1 hypothetical protein BKL49_11135 [Rodentibacter myodis]
MKKTLISAVILTALFTAGCQDKETQAEIEWLNQRVAQLTEENKQLQLDLLANNLLSKERLPAIFTEEDVVFKKAETIKYPPSKEDYVLEEGRIEYAISTLKTNIDWLNTLLWQELTRKAENVPTREQLIAGYQQDFEQTRKEMLKEPSIGFNLHRWVGFLGQKEKLATFFVGFYDYTGGAHGIGGNHYFTIDLTTHKILKLSDLFDEQTLPKLKALLWERYTEYGNVKEDEVFTSKDNFNVSENIYLDSEGVHFIYGVYEIQPYAAGEQDLTLEWWRLMELLKPDFKQQNYVKLREEIVD